MCRMILHTRPILSTCTYSGTMCAVITHRHKDMRNWNAFHVHANANANANANATATANAVTSSMTGGPE